MTDLSQALAEISAIRAQVARGTQFRGYGPASIAVSGLLALAVAAAQSWWWKSAAADVGAFLTVWVATAAIAVALTSVETIIRARRVHSGFATEMIHSAIEHFLPALIAGFLLTGVLLLAAPHEIWLLPGLWEVIFSLGVFASWRFLSRPMFGVAVWYLVAGLTSLMIASGSKLLLPWEMGVPFGVGQLLVAAVLQFDYKDSIEEH